MRERKAGMALGADAFCIPPGGFGTLEEMFEILTLRQLQLHHKPMIFLNTAGFFDPLLVLFEHLCAERFTREDSRDYYHVAKEPIDLFNYLEGCQTVKPSLTPKS